MSEVKRYEAVHLRYEDSNIRYGEGCEVEVVTARDYAALEAECERLREQVKALQSDANSWQSGYDKGRADGEKSAQGWKEQHGRDSAELRRLCSERDALRAELEAINGQEPVGHVYTMQPCFPGEPKRAHAQLHVSLPAGTKLFALPPAKADEVSVRRIAQLEALLQRIRYHHIEGNIEPTVRDIINGMPDANDIYGYCAEVSAEIDALLASGKEG